MGYVQTLQTVKLFCSIFSQDSNKLNKAKEILTGKFGLIDFESGLLNFDYTKYYEDEFGKDLKRVFVSFKKITEPDQLWKIKIATNRIENKLKTKDKRTVNIDPGYISQASLVLATTKPYSHRIYINKGIYEEVTLLYKNSAFESLSWTYPDYKNSENIKIFLKIREILCGQLKRAKT